LNIEGENAGGGLATGVWGYIGSRRAADRLKLIKELRSEALIELKIGWTVAIDEEQKVSWGVVLRLPDT
jgi:hypothetical protein